MKKAILVLMFLAVAILAGCTNEQGARETLSSMGYTNITMTGYQAFMCSDDDTYHTGFAATAPGGGTVEGCVCEGWLKGKTIRIK